jgi:CRISPR-associated endoribonuclease Cas6
LRLIIKFSFKNPFKLVVNYNHLLQSMLYNSLDPEFASFLHDHGYEGGGRKFKLFSFSRLLGKYQINEGRIEFESPVKLVVTSPAEQFCHSLLNGLLTKDEVTIGQDLVRVESVKVEKPIVTKESMKLKLLSPAVAYSTLYRADGSKYTCYYQPGDAEFTRVAAENLRKKYSAFYTNEAPEGEIKINPVHQTKLHVLEYKGNVIKGYSGTLFINGPQELLQMAVDAGLGSKNSMGFGCGIIDESSANRKGVESDYVVDRR